MLTTKAAKPHRAWRSKTALISAVSLSLATSSLALMAPAHAADSAAPAQVSYQYPTGQITPDTPHPAGDWGNWKKVAYSGKIFFPYGGHLVQVRQDRWERDKWPDEDDYLGTSYFSKYFYNGGTFTFGSTHLLKQTDHGYDKTEEVYQKVSYRVYKNGHWSPWSNWVYSGIGNIHR